jgi:hypothetical protein
MDDDSNHGTKRKNENDDEDDPSVLSERCQQSHQKRVKQMEEEKDKLQNEIDTMNSIVGPSASNDDVIIEINAGGKIISALRSTLTLAPDTMFTYMFSGRWEESMKRDGNGRVYLDHDPELIEIIVNFLRMKKIEDLSKLVRSPTVRIEKRNDFGYLVRYFGLAEFFSLSLDIAKIDVVQPNGSSIDVTKSENKIHFNKVNGGDDLYGGNDFYFVACKPSLDISSGEGSFWKVTIDVLPEYQWFFLGIIGNLGASNSSYKELTSYGWCSDSGIYHGGSSGTGEYGWAEFTQGECLHFHLKSNKLTMFSIQKNKKFVIDIAIPLHEYYIHFNVYNFGIKLTLEPLGEDERTRMLEN